MKLALALVISLCVFGRAQGATIIALPQGGFRYYQGVEVFRNDQSEHARKFFREGHAHLREKRYGAAAEAFKRAATWGQNFAEAYVNLSLTYLLLERYEDAAEAGTNALNLKTANRAVAALAHLHRGRAYNQIGKPEQAARDFDEVVRLDPPNASAYLNRAWTNLYLARGDAAATDARYYLGLKGWGDVHSPYMVIVANLGFRQAGHDALAKELLEVAASKMGKSSWPYPVIRYLRREATATAQDLLGHAKDKGQMTEAHTYIGMDRALAGHPDEALAHLKWVKDNGERRYFEYQLAVNELSRMIKGNTSTVKQ